MNKTFLNRFYAGDKLYCTGCTKQMSDHRLRRIHFHVFCLFSKYFFDCNRLKQIVVMCAGSMCIDVCHIFWLNSCLFNCIFHRSCSSGSVLNRRSDVVCIRSCTVSHDFSENMRASCLRMLEFFQNNNACTFTQNKAVSFLIKRNGTSLWICGSRKRSQSCETAYSDWSNCRLCTARKHHICIAALNTSVGLTDAVCSCRTGCHYINIFSSQAKLNGYISCCHIGNHHRHHQRTHTVWSFLQVFLMLTLDCLKASDTGTNGASNCKRIFLFHIKPGLLHRLFCSCHCILAKQFHSPCILRVHIFLRLKIFYFCCQMYFKIRRIKMGNLSKPCLSFFQSVPKFLYI